MEEALSDAAAAIPQPARCSNILDRFMVHIYCLFIYALLFAHALCIRRHVRFVGQCYVSVLMLLELELELLFDAKILSITICSMPILVNLVNLLLAARAGFKRFLMRRLRYGNSVSHI